MSVAPMAFSAKPADLPRPRIAGRTLTVTWNFGGRETVRSFTGEGLLARPDVQAITVEADPGYQVDHVMTAKKKYLHAIPAAEIFKGIGLPKNGVIAKFICLDNFSATIDLESILNGAKDGAQAYLAIEADEENWGPVHPEVSSASAGPFYLIWINANKPIQAGDVIVPNWPYQLSGFQLIEKSDENK